MVSGLSKMLLVVAILAAWGAVSVVYDSLLMPNPVDVLVRLVGLFSGMEIIGDLTSTLLKILISLAIGSLSGLLIGIVISRWDWTYDSVSPILDFSRSIPATALFPLFLLAFGAGDPTSIALATWICAIYLSLHVSKGLRKTDETSLMVAKSLKKSDLDILIHVRFMAALPIVFVGFRTAVSLTVVIVIVTEMFVGTESGLGKALIDASYVYDIPKLYAVILIVGIIGYMLNFLVARIEEKIVHWHGK
jgi:NitT/TauT family transport system permease protein